MVRRYYNLPSLTALAAFESCARHMSQKLAATELNVTPGAVSRQIKALEDELGTPLFLRETSGVSLTPSGEDLYSVLARGFSEASEALERIRAGGDQASVTLASTNAFAGFWLMRKMGTFWRDNPGIAVNHMMSDNATHFRRSEIDLRIRYGSGVWPDETSVLLFRERIFPVCGANFARENAGASAAAIADLPLLHVDGVDPEWTNWEEFLRRAGIGHGPLRGRRFNNFSILVQAAQDDQGIALGWERLIWPLLEQKKLVRFSDLVIDAPAAYYLTRNDNRSLSPAAAKLEDWLVETAHQDHVQTAAL